MTPREAAALAPALVARQQWHPRDAPWEYEFIASLERLMAEEPGLGGALFERPAEEYAEWHERSLSYELAEASSLRFLTDDPPITAIIPRYLTTRPRFEIEFIDVPQSTGERIVATIAFAAYTFMVVAGYMGALM